MEKNKLWLILFKRGKIPFPPKQALTDSENTAFVTQEKDVTSPLPKRISREKKRIGKQN